MTDIEALRAKARTLLELALAELDGDLFTLVIHLEEAVKTVEALEDAVMDPDEDAVEIAPVEVTPVDSREVTALVRETFEALETTRDRVDVESLRAWVVAGLSLFPHGRLPKLDVLVDEARRALVTRAHQLCGGNITHAARAMNTSRRTVRSLLERYGLRTGPSRATAAAVHESQPGPGPRPRSPA